MGVRTGVVAHCIVGLQRPPLQERWPMGSLFGGGGSLLRKGLHRRRGRGALLLPHCLALDTHSCCPLPPPPSPSLGDQKATLRLRPAAPPLPKRRTNTHDQMTVPLSFFHSPLCVACPTTTHSFLLSPPPSPSTHSKTHTKLDPSSSSSSYAPPRPLNAFTPRGMPPPPRLPPPIIPAIPPPPMPVVCVGGWVGWVEEIKAVRTSYWELGGLGWVGEKEEEEEGG